MNGVETDSRSRFAAAMMLVVLGCTVVGAAATKTVSLERQSPELSPTREAGISQLRERLEALSPARPMEYFELAEELAYLSAIAPHQRVTALRMSTQLYVLAFELEPDASRSRMVGRSVCLALADIAPPEDRDWLLALAASFGRDVGSRGLLSAIDAGSAEDAARADVAEALGRYRAVERQALSAIMRRVDIRRQMRDAGVSADDITWVMSLLEEGLQRPFCPECRNQRIVRVGTGDQRVEQRLCGTCFGNPEPDPPLSRNEFRRMLAIEAQLLDADPQTWSAEAMTTGAQPIVDLDPSALAERYGVDASKPYWIAGPAAALSGQWSETPPRN